MRFRQCAVRRRHYRLCNKLASLKKNTHTHDVFFIRRLSPRRSRSTRSVTEAEDGWYPTETAIRARIADVYQNRSFSCFFIITPIRVWIYMYLFTRIRLIVAASGVEFLPTECSVVPRAEPRAEMGPKWFWRADRGTCTSGIDLAVRRVIPWF